MKLFEHMHKIQQESRVKVEALQMKIICIKSRSQCTNKHLVRLENFWLEYLHNVFWLKMCSQNDFLVLLGIMRRVGKYFKY